MQPRKIVQIYHTGLNLEALNKTNLIIHTMFMLFLQRLYC